MDELSDSIYYTIFHIPTIGSILLAGILALIYLLTNDAIKKITGHNDLLLLSLIPSIYLFLYSMTVDHSLTPIIATFLGLLIMGLFIKSQFALGLLSEKFILHFPPTISTVF